jgi:hypothetical protein
LSKQSCFVLNYENYLNPEEVIITGEVRVQGQFIRPEGNRSRTAAIQCYEPFSAAELTSASKF